MVRDTVLTRMTVNFFIMVSILFTDDKVPTASLPKVVKLKKGKDVKNDSNDYYTALGRNDND
jgi:hypothetical protein